MERFWISVAVQVSQGTGGHAQPQARFVGPELMAAQQGSFSSPAFLDPLLRYRALEVPGLEVRESRPE
jgi:hypothetical protein